MTANLGIVNGVSTRDVANLGTLYGLPRINRTANDGIEDGVNRFPRLPGVPSGRQMLRELSGWASTGPATATRSTLGASLSDSNKFGGGVIGPDGLIYGMPFNSTDILIIDPASQTARRSTLGASLSGSFKWFGGVLGPDGLIYGIPHDSTNILIIDPATQTAQRSTLVASLSGSAKFVGGVLGPDGRIYGIPSGFTNILQITAPGTATTRPVYRDAIASPQLNKF